VDARSVSDIQHAVKFATSHNLRLITKNTGHDYFGRSTARGGFMLWTHYMKDITYNATFVPQGAPKSETYDAITLGAGVQWFEAYDAIQTHGRVLVGGISLGGSVGAAGGWLLGGGHSILSPQHGLGVDNVVEINIVTSTGSYLTSNSHQHPDLFWALRGGGGGTFGVVTSVTYRTHPSVPVTAAFFNSSATSPTTMKKLFTEFVRIHPALSDAGFAGYGAISNTSLGWFYLAPNVSVSAANKSVEPFFEYAQNLTSEGLDVTVAMTTSYESFYAWYQSFIASGDQDGNIAELASRLVPRDLFEGDYRQLADALFDINGIVWHLVAGGAVSKINPDSTGLNPSWRKALVHVTFGIGWDEGAPFSEIEKLRAELALSLKKLSNVMPNAGSYFNEGSLFETNPEQVFFGSHYDKLKAIKDKYDPLGLFVVTEGVGSDDWNRELTCRQ
jgi:FAD/FMN-containing dehydrogenase